MPLSALQPSPGDSAGFFDFPPTASTIIQNWEWFNQFYRALDEVASAGGFGRIGGNGIFPPTTHIWDGNDFGAGVTLDPSGTSLTDPNKEWCPLPMSAATRYYDWSTVDPPPSMPNLYSVVLLRLYGGQWDWRNMLVLPITGQVVTGPDGDGDYHSNQLTFDPIDTVNYPLSQYTHYFIINQSGSWSSQRMPEWPNDFTLDFATSIGANAISLIVDGTSKPSWNASGKLTTGPGNALDWSTLWAYYTNTDGNTRSAQVIELVPSAGAMAHATLSGMALSSVVVDVKGIGYLTAPTVTISGDGTGAAATAVLVNGQVDHIDVDAGGSGYTAATVTITGGEGNWAVHFASQSPIPVVGLFGILSSAGKYWRAERQSYSSPLGVDVAPYKAWYRGGDVMTDSRASHYPDDTLRDTSFPSYHYEIPGFEEGYDTPINVINPDDQYPVYTDQDVTTLLAEDHFPPDQCFTKPLWTTLRSWQSALWQACGSFIPYRSDRYDGFKEFWINPFLVPKFMWHAQVNAAKGTTGTLRTGGINVSVSATSAPDAGTLPVPVLICFEKIEQWELWEDVTITNDGWTATGLGTSSWHDIGPETHDLGMTLGGGVFSGTWDGGSNLQVNDLPADNRSFEQQRVYITWGWTRRVCDQCRYPFYARTCFIPSANDDDTGAADVSETNPGFWVTRDANSALLDFTDYGKANGIVMPVTGSLVRYIGDNFNDPTTIYSMTDWLKDFYDRFYEGKRAPGSTRFPPAETLGEAREADTLSGTVMASTINNTAFQFVASTAANYLWPDGVLGGDGTYTMATTVTPDVGGVTTTSLKDSSHSGSVFWGGRFVGQWVVIQQPGIAGDPDGPCHNARRAITAATGDTITFGAITGLTATYDSGTHLDNPTTAIIEEPNTEKNYWKDSKITLTKASNGAVLTATILYNADDIFHIGAWSGGATYTPAAGDSWIAARISTGTVWRWNGSSYEVPTGIDARVGARFPSITSKIPPTFHIRYGRAMKHDYFSSRTGKPTFFDEVYKARNALCMVKIDNNFTSVDANGQHHKNSNTATSRDVVYDGTNWSDATANTAARWASLISLMEESSFANPQTVYFNANEHDNAANAFRLMGWGAISIDPGILANFSVTFQRLRIPAIATWLAYAQTDPADYGTGNYRLGSGEEYPSGITAPLFTWYTTSSSFNDTGEWGPLTYYYPSGNQAFTDYIGLKELVDDVTLYTFDANGDPVVERKWKKYAADSGAITLHRLSDSPLGHDLDNPALPDATPSPIFATSALDGYDSLYDGIPAHDPDNHHHNLLYFISPAITNIKGYWVRQGMCILDWRAGMKYLGTPWEE